jgi:hypothetical protein
MQTGAFNVLGVESVDQPGRLSHSCAAGDRQSAPSARRLKSREPREAAQRRTAEPVSGCGVRGPEQVGRRHVVAAQGSTF